MRRAPLRGREKGKKLFSARATGKENGEEACRIRPEGHGPLLQLLLHCIGAPPPPPPLPRKCPRAARSNLRRNCAPPPPSLGSTGLFFTFCQLKKQPALCLCTYLGTSSAHKREKQSRQERGYRCSRTPRPVFPTSSMYLCAVRSTGPPAERAQHMCKEGGKEKKAHVGEGPSVGPPWTATAAGLREWHTRAKAKKVLSTYSSEGDCACSFPFWSAFSGEENASFDGPHMLLCAAHAQSWKRVRRESDKKTRESESRPHFLSFPLSSSSI